MWDVHHVTTSHLRLSLYYVIKLLKCITDMPQSNILKIGYKQISKRISRTLLVLNKFK